MFVILSTRPGQFRTEPGPGLEPVEAWDYRYAGALRVHFVIARLQAETRVVITEDEAPHAVNRVPTKFLPRHATLEAARAELEQLTRRGGARASLVPALA